MSTSPHSLPYNNDRLLLFGEGEGFFIFRVYFSFNLWGLAWHSGGDGNCRRLYYTAAGWSRESGSVGGLADSPAGCGEIAGFGVPVLVFLFGG